MIERKEEKVRFMPHCFCWGIKLSIFWWFLRCSFQRKKYYKRSIGVKQLSKDPWSDDKLLNKYAVGTVHFGLVRNLTNFGLFVELEEGIDGLVHVSDLSEDKKIKHPSEFINLGEKLEVIVMEQDLENRRLALSHKDINSGDSKKEKTKKEK